MIGIYSIKNKINNKLYIGQSIDIYRRWNQHRLASKDPSNSSYYNELYTDMRHYGIENFEFNIVEETTKQQLDEKEVYYMKKFHTLENGYNISANAGQRICIENIETNKKYMFSTFQQCENWIHSNNISTGKNLAPFLKRKIKSKEIIYNKYKIYYWR